MYIYVEYIHIYIAGTEASRRNNEIQRLNSEYQAMVELNLSSSSIYYHMVSSENYRMLSQYHYSMSEAPLRSSRISNPPEMTDVRFIHTF